MSNINSGKIHNLKISSNGFCSSYLPLRSKVDLINKHLKDNKEVRYSHTSRSFSSTMAVTYRTMNRIQSNIKRIVPIFILIAAIFSTLKTNAQDTIYLKSGNPEIIAKILEVYPTNLKYNKYSNIEGPIYTIDKDKIEKVVYQNGEVEEYSFDSINTQSFERQSSQNLIPGSKVFLTFSLTKGKDNVNGSDAIEMLKSYIEGKTTCVVVNSIDEADFVIELQVIKLFMADRKAKIVVKHILTNTDVFESKWKRGSSTAFSGYSGSRAAIGKVVKNDLLKNYPEIEI